MTGAENGYTFRNFEKIEGYSRKYKFPSGKRCIVIGANRSVKDFDLGQRIDSEDIFVIRINKPPNKEYFPNYGQRTDIFVGCANTKTELEGIGNKILLAHGDILDMSKGYFPDKKWLTTGFLSILFSLCNFKTVNIFGFGYPGEKETDQFSETTYSDKKTHYRNHDLNFEHEEIHRLCTNYKKCSVSMVEVGGMI